MEKAILENGSAVKTTLKLPGKKDFFTQEAFKTLRTNLQFCGQDICAVVITSCNENEGKTTIIGKKPLLSIPFILILSTGLFGHFPVYQVTKGARNGFFIARILAFSMDAMGLLSRLLTLLEATFLCALYFQIPCGGIYRKSASCSETFDTLDL